MLIGRYYVRAGEDFMSVVETEGQDVDLMMAAMDNLGRAFRLEVIFAVVLSLVGAVSALTHFGSLAGG
jgi:hypothetical protein